MKSRWSEPSLTLITAIMVILIAVLAGGSLWAVRRMHGQVAHNRAAQSVLDEGKRLAVQLAAIPLVRTASEQADWKAISPIVQSLHAAEKGLQYVSVSCEGVTLFHEQTSALDASAPSPSPDSIAAGDVRYDRRILNVGTQEIPVVVIATRFTGHDGKSRVLELALRKETVEREEFAPTAAIASMFRVSLLTVSVSFLACAVLVVWMMHRERRRELQRRSEEHLAFAGVLANGIVHDFRNPMSSLRLDAQMLQKETGKGAACRADRVGELADRMRTTLDRMDKVFQEFLYVSRPAADEAETFELCACLRECCAMLAPRFEHKKLKSDLRMPESPLPVTGRRASIQRALLNVLTNAEQFSPEGGVVVVAASRAEHRAVIEVLDSGPGIPTADLDRIFDMFHSGRPGGTGLGLFLAKTALEGSGGSIQASNRPEGGACLRMTLPLAETKT
jgi:signal transduction histidine kinase